MLPANVPRPTQRSRRLGLLAFLTGLIIWLYVELRYQSQMAEKSTAPAGAGAQRMRRVGTGAAAAAEGGSGSGSGNGGGGGGTNWGPGHDTAGELREDFSLDMSRVDAPSALPDDFEMLYNPEWSEHLAFERLPADRLAPLTHQAQRMLYRHQFPQTCEGRKYLVSSGNEELAGLGSHIHIATVHMAIAYIQNRIFIWEPWAGYIYTDADTCDDPPDYVPPGYNPKLKPPPGAMGSGGWVSCFFRSPTNCTLAHATGPGVDAEHLGTGGIGMQWGIYPDTIPQPFAAMWEKAGMPMDKGMMKYWWRGQVAAFFTRFHPRALEKLRALRVQTAQYMRNATAGRPGNATWLTAAAAALPLPRGTVSIHIRHGDKSKEMNLVPTARYLQAAEGLVEANPFGYQRIAFMSTEDPSAIAEMEASPLSKDWRWLWWEVPRINSNGPEQLVALDMKRGELTMIWWLQLFIALEADGWVGTRGSNWNRLIDELRCVWLPKCQNVYVEVGDDASWKGPHGPSKSQGWCVAGERAACVCVPARAVTGQLPLPSHPLPPPSHPLPSVFRYSW
jgi:hypothetical protein